MVMKMCGLCFKQALITTFRIFNTALVCCNVQLIPKFNSPIFFLLFSWLYSNNHNVQCTWFLLSLNISKQWIYLQCVVTIYTKALAHIYNCPCVDLFLLDQCVINVVYVCLSCLKVIGQYATWRCAHSWMIFFHCQQKLSDYLVF